MRFVPAALMPRSLPRPIGVPAARAVDVTRKQERDLRVDLFRGLALWFIFLDHVPSNSVGQLTLRNFGFSDATEMFVFISGYSAAIAYGRCERKFGFVYMTAHVWRRCWQLYVAHLILFLFYTAQIAWIAARFQNTMYVEELNIARFLEAPHIALIEALTLRFRPANLDILPLYIVLLLIFPFVQRALRVMPFATLAGSIALYLAARFLDWNLPTAVDGVGWFFDPFSWQLLFFLGTLCAIRPDWLGPLLRWRPWVAGIAALYLIGAALLVSSWQFATIGDALARVMPTSWLEWIYPVDKTRLDVLRLAHFLAMAYLVVGLVPASAGFLSSRWLQPLIACGRQSLYVFCLGIFLSFAAHFALVEFNGGVAAQVGVSVAGIGLMVGLAMLMNWYRAREAAGSRRGSTRTVNG